MGAGNGGGSGKSGSDSNSGRGVVGEKGITTKLDSDPDFPIPRRRPISPLPLSPPHFANLASQPVRAVAHGKTQRLPVHLRCQRDDFEQLAHLVFVDEFERLRPLRQWGILQIIDQAAVD